MVRGGQFGLEVLLHHLRRVLALVGDDAGHHVVERRAQRVDVRLRTDRVEAHDLLGADVVRRAERLAFLRFGGLFVGDRAGEPHVGEFHNLALGDHDVLGLHVAVNQPALMGVLERLGDLDRDLDRTRLVVPLVLDDVVVDGSAVHVLHHKVVRFTVLTDVERLHDVGVVELRGRLALTEKPLDELRVAREFLRQNLYRDVAIQAPLLGAIDLRHRALAQFLELAVSGDAPALLVEPFAQPSHLALRRIPVVDEQFPERLLALLVGFPHQRQAVLDLLGCREPLIDNRPAYKRVEIRPALRGLCPQGFLSPDRRRVFIICDRRREPSGILGGVRVAHADNRLRILFGFWLVHPTPNCVRAHPGAKCGR